MGDFYLKCLGPLHTPGGNGTPWHTCPGVRGIGWDSLPQQCGVGSLCSLPWVGSRELPLGGLPRIRSILTAGEFALYCLCTAGHPLFHGARRQLSICAVPSSCEHL